MRCGPTGIRGAARQRLHRAVEREEPEPVAALAAGERRAAGEHDDVLLALVLEHRRRRVHAAVRLELPQLLAGGLVHGREAAIVAADENEPAGGDDRAAVALVDPLLAPRDAIRLEVDDGEHAAPGRGEARDDAAGIERAGLDGIIRVATRPRPSSESVAQMYMRFVSGSYELGGQFTAASGFHTAGVLVKGVKMRPSLTSSKPSGAMSMDCGTMASPTGNGCVGEVYCCGSCITGVSSMPSSGLPLVAIEDVDPAGLAGLRDALAQLCRRTARRRGSRDSARRSPRCRDAPAGSASGTCPVFASMRDDRDAEEVVALAQVRRSAPGPGFAVEK